MARLLFQGRTDFGLRIGLRNSRDISARCRIITESPETKETFPSDVIVLRSHRKTGSLEEMHDLLKLSPLPKSIPTL
ncbi:hypothetical protein KOR42_27050 [Thalassoglobus neptunius]|uniref:Uncharacterized protein n=1 Tax=Thalassoglobus neptunius TaxID=1938619 RepID=A0A5C5WYA4_9PLAN|nr:hypothetical protein KOR42_27050 [Thalassoglobus neptunius]